MKKYIFLIITVSIFIFICILLYDYMFLDIELEIEDIYIGEPFLNIGNYDVIDEYSDNITTNDDVKVLHITIHMHNKSFLKKYKNLELEFDDDNDLYPFVGKRFDMGWESGIIKNLNSRQEYTRSRITAIVDKNLDDDEILELISNKKVNLRGTICLFGVNLYVAEGVSNDAELKTQCK